MKLEHIKILEEMNACGDAIDYAKTKESLEQAWLECERGDWLLWFAARLEVDRKLLVSAVCDCAELAIKHVKDGEKRPAEAIRITRLWIKGQATLEEVRIAAHAANAAYTAACAAANVTEAHKEAQKRTSEIVRKYITWNMIVEKIA